MKKAISLFIALFVTIVSIAQSPVTFADAGNGYDKFAATDYHFTFDSSISAETINNSATQFTQYITVTAADNGQGHDVTITPTNNQEVNRRTIYRYFYIVGVSEINAEGSTITLDDFMITYINQML